MKQLLAYQEILATRGVTWGLIGPREVDRLWDRHIDNCLAVTESALLPEGSTVVDVGSGAGLPGVVWAIARPDLTVTLVEPLERRVTFLNDVREELELANLVVIRGRAQDVDIRGEVVTARAVAATKSLVRWLVPLVSQGGRMVLLKGQKAEQELAEAAPWLTRKGWCGDVQMVGTPARTRVIVVERRTQG